MDHYGFYTGTIFDAHEFLGAHLEGDGVTFRVYAPRAAGVCIIGEFSNWENVEMHRMEDAQFYECHVPGAKAGQMYKVRIYQKNGACVDHMDPYGFGMELRPGTASIIRDRKAYKFGDEHWMKNRTNASAGPVNIYEVNLGSWQSDETEEHGWPTYEKIAEPLIHYVREHGYNYIEIMPICEYPCDESWGYQAMGFFAPTARYGTMDGLKYLIDLCHQNKVGVILDFAPVHFAVNGDGLANFDGTALYEYPNNDVGYNEWGSKNFMHSRGEVRAYLQSAAMYWLQDYHFDGIRMDAISNIIYWQGDPKRGVNAGAVDFIKHTNRGLKEANPGIMMIAEDSTSFPDVTKPVEQGGLGFDYKWDMGWMNDTLDYFKKTPEERSANYHKLSFSMHYFYDERFLLPLSHDEMVHGKATILQKMSGEYEKKFPQARAFYAYMYAHPGKKLLFMGNEFGQLREWDEKREQDWLLLEYPIHRQFLAYTTELNNMYLKHSALYENEVDWNGFQWVDIESVENCSYGFIRKSANEAILAVFHFKEEELSDYSVQVQDYKKATLILDSNWERFGGEVKEVAKEIEIENGVLKTKLGGMNACYYLLEK